MKFYFKTVLFAFLLFTQTTFLFSQKADSLTFVKAKWEKTTINENIIVKKFHFNKKNLFKSNQYIVYAEIPQNGKFRFDFVHTDSLDLTSNLAIENDALIAVNGSFFDIYKSNPVCYLKIKGSKKGENIHPDKTERKYYQYGVLYLNSKGKIAVQKAEADKNYEDKLPYDNIMTTGPLLRLTNSDEIQRDELTFVYKRHNRTAIGIRNDNSVILITIDGRTKQAEGMSLYEVRKIMKWLGCHTIVNLDGGGSTTFYQKGQPNNGILNFPSDNHRFDKEGERKVSNILIVK